MSTTCTSPHSSNSVPDRPVCALGVRPILWRQLLPTSSALRKCCEPPLRLLGLSPGSCFLLEERQYSCSPGTGFGARMPGWSRSALPDCDEKGAVSLRLVMREAVSQAGAELGGGQAQRPQGGRPVAELRTHGPRPGGSFLPRTCLVLWLRPLTLHMAGPVVWTPDLSQTLCGKKQGLENSSSASSPQDRGSDRIRHIQAQKQPKQTSKPMAARTSCPGRA